MSTWTRRSWVWNYHFFFWSSLGVGCCPRVSPRVRISPNFYWSTCPLHQTSLICWPYSMKHKCSRHSGCYWRLWSSYLGHFFSSPRIWQQLVKTTVPAIPIVFVERAESVVVDECSSSTRCNGCSRTMLGTSTNWIWWVVRPLNWLCVSWRWSNLMYAVIRRYFSLAKMALSYFCNSIVW